MVTGTEWDKTSPRKKQSEMDRAKKMEDWGEAEGEMVREANVQVVISPGSQQDLRSWLGRVTHREGLAYKVFYK